MNTEINGLEDSVSMLETNGIDLYYMNTDILYNTNENINESVDDISAYEFINFNGIQHDSVFEMNDSLTVSISSFPSDVI
jgi:hypothetical protein